MADLLALGLEHLADQLDAFAAQTVVYSRRMSGQTKTAAVLATKGRSIFEQQDEAGAVTRFESVDWLISPALLVLDGSQRLPAAGDRISAGGLVYEVMPFGAEPSYRVDPHRTKIRIHTKLVG